MSRMNKEELYTAFKEKNLPTSYSSEEVLNYLINTLKAQNLSVKEFLKLDPTIKKNGLWKVLVINDPEILSNLFTQAEKREHELQKKDHIENPINLEDYPSKDHASLEMWSDIETGKRLNILLYKSLLSKKITGYTLQGECKKVLMELDVLSGVDKMDLENDEFVKYLNLLYELDKI